MPAPLLYLALSVFGYQVYQHEKNKLYEYELVFNNGTKIANVYTNARSLPDWLNSVLQRRSLCNAPDLMLQYYDVKSDKMITFAKSREPFTYLFNPCTGHKPQCVYTKK